MSTLDEVRTLRATALRLLPGFRQAKAQMNIAIAMLHIAMSNGRLAVTRLLE